MDIKHWLSEKGRGGLQFIVFYHGDGVVLCAGSVDDTESLLELAVKRLQELKC